MTFFGCKFGFGKCFGTLLSPASELVVTIYHIKSAFHCTSQSNGEMVLCCCVEKRRRHFKTMVFFICGPLMRHPLIELFHLSNLLQRPNNHSMVDAEFFGSFSGSCKRISFDGSLSWWLSTSDGWPSSRLLFPLQNFLNHHCTVVSLAVPEPNALWMEQVPMLGLKFLPTETQWREESYGWVATSLCNTVTILIWCVCFHPKHFYVPFMCLLILSKATYGAETKLRLGYT